jgi:hypothetical protein
MNYPKFFDDIEKIRLKDELSAFLGTFEDGVVEFSYLDVVKSAGHSCPTVAGAYLATREALKRLYKDELPKRGEIRVDLRESQTEGVIGVIAQVITNITGATSDFGFKGINGKFNRTNLLFFSQDIDSEIKFTRLDTNESVLVDYNPKTIKPAPKQMELFQKALQGVATSQELAEFGKLWQDRVERIFKSVDSVLTIR